MYEILRGVNVEASSAPVKGGNEVTIVIGNRYEHTFPKYSRISKSMDEMTERELSERLTGGTYFVVEGELVDFRDNAYRGFVHSDSAIDILMDILGFVPANRRMKKSYGFNTMSDNIILASNWSKQPIEIPEYQEGGRFDSNLKYAWSPFYDHVRAVFELVRLICTNGMVGTTELVNTKIPVVNRWEEHLDIASQRIQNQISSLVSKRLSSMGTERASVGELMLIAEHARNRITEEGYSNMDEHATLERIAMIADPRIHLQDYYKDSVFKESAVAAQLPGHLSVFNLWNLATELSSHTSETQSSSQFALQRLANGVVFDKHDKRDQRVNRFQTQPMDSFWSSPEIAFFGR